MFLLWIRTSMPGVKLFPVCNRLKLCATWLTLPHDNFTDGLTCLLIDSLIARLIDGTFYWYIEWLGRLADSLRDWLIDLLVDSWTEWVSDCLSLFEYLLHACTLSRRCVLTWLWKFILRNQKNLHCRFMSPKQSDIFS